MTDQEAGDATQVEALLDQIDGPISEFTADGAYDCKFRGMSPPDSDMMPPPNSEN
jgi:hypothetical protein